MASPRTWRSRIRGGQGGFTMIELLMTMLLLGVVLLGLAALQIGVVRQNSAAKRSNEATRLCQAQIERYLNMGFASVPGLSTPDQFNPETNADNQQMSNVGPNGSGSGPFNVESYFETVGANKLVTVRVRWRDVTAQGGERDVHMTIVRTP